MAVHHAMIHLAVFQYHGRAMSTFRLEQTAQIFAFPDLFEKYE
jgi:hypothetical protein